MPCQCSSIQFGTVDEVLERDSLLVIDPISDCQDVKEAQEEKVLTEVTVSTLKDVKEPIDAVEASFEAASQNNPQN